MPTVSWLHIVNLYKAFEQQNHRAVYLPPQNKYKRWPAYLNFFNCLQFRQTMSFNVFDFLGLFHHFNLSNKCMCDSLIIWSLELGCWNVQCECSFWFISINSSHVTAPHLKATLSLWKHQTNRQSCQKPKIMKTQIMNLASSSILGFGLIQSNITIFKSHQILTFYPGWMYSIKLPTNCFCLALCSDDQRCSSIAPEMETCRPDLDNWTF